MTRRYIGQWITTFAVVATASTGVAALENGPGSQLAHTANSLAPLRAPGEEASRPDDLSSGLEAYIAYALRTSPVLRASFERWRAAVHRVSQARRLPEPTLSWGYYVQSVETRVGPQRLRLSLRQSFPWPTKLTAGADAAAAQAQAAGKIFDAQVLALKQRITVKYVQLWLVRRTQSIKRDQLDILHGLAASVRARVATGRAALADQQQVDLAEVRLANDITGLGERERTARAALGAEIGAPAGIHLPTPDEPHTLDLPAEPVEKLRTAALEHPAIESLWLRRASQTAKAKSADADRRPGFALGLDWIATGEASLPGISDSGKDAVIINVGVSLPLWQGSYRESVLAARADAAAEHAGALAAADRAAFELEASLAAIADGVRSAQFYADTLLPRAQATYQSVLGAYTTGRSTVAAALLAQRDLLELQLDLKRARAAYAMAWARLEEVVGREVKRREVTGAGVDPRNSDYE